MRDYNSELPFETAPYIVPTLLPVSTTPLGYQSPDAVRCYITLDTVTPRKRHVSLSAHKLKQATSVPLGTVSQVRSCLFVIVPSLFLVTSDISPPINVVHI